MTTGPRRPPSGSGRMIMSYALSKKKALERIFVFQAVEYGYLTQEQLKDCIDEHDRREPPIPLLTICKQRKYLTPSQVNHLMSKRLDASVARAFGEGLTQREEPKKPSIPMLSDTSEEKAQVSVLAVEEREEYERRLAEKDRLLEREQKQREFLKRKSEELEQKVRNYEQLKQKQLEKKQKEIINLEAELSCYRGLKEQNDQQLQNFRMMVEEKDILIKREQQKAKGLFNLLEQGGRELRESEEQRLKAEAELEKKDKEIDFLKHKLDKENKERGELKKDLETNQEQTRRLVRELEELRTSPQHQEEDEDPVKKELEKRSREQTALIAKLKEKDLVEADLAGQLATLKNEHEAVLEKLRQQHKKIQERIEGEKGRMEEDFHEARISLESELSQYRQKSESLEAKLQQYQDNLKGWDDLEKQKEEYKKQIDQEKRRRVESEKEKQLLQERIQQMEEKIARFQQGKIAADEELESGTILPGSDGEYYMVQKVLGRGGMGIAYSALRGSDESIVVVKTLFPEAMSDMKILMRFVQEARTIMNFHHENLVQGFDLQQGRSLSYFVMEFLDGDSLEDMLEEQGLLDPVESTRIVLGIARALKYLEQHHLVHRDVKPANIIVNSDKVAKLVDFGIVKMTDRTCSLTTDGIILGTPYYLSPEQTYQTDVDIRSDIYCLGATYYHMVIGEVPFPGDNPIDVIQKRLVKSPKPGKVKPDLPKPIGNVIEKMMSKSAKKRHVSAAELVSELEDVLKKIGG